MEFPIRLIKDADPATLSRIGNRIRQAAIGAAFIALLNQAEIKTGDSFSVDLSVSVTDPMTIEITVPVPWIDTTLAESMGSIVAITSVDSLAQIMDLPFEDPAILGDPAILEDPADFEDPADL